MPFPFRCPHCGFETTVDDRFAGWTGPCKACNATVTMGAAAKPGRGGGGGKSWSAGLIVLVIVVPVVLLMLLAVGGVLVALLLPAVQSARGAARAAQSKNNMRQIAIALHMYHEMHKALPPAHTVDENGRPMHSWRVMLLPVLADSDPSARAAADAYNFAEPWDSPGNQAVVNMMPSIYRSPADTAPPGHTSYLWITGPGTPQPGSQPIRFANVRQGISNTPMIAEKVSSGVVWTEPTDTDLNQLNNYLQNLSDPRGGNVAFYDAAVRSLSAGDPALQPGP